MFNLNIGILFHMYVLQLIINVILCEQLGDPPITSLPGLPSCNPLANPPILGDCWYNCTSEDIPGDDKKHRLRKVNLFI